MSKKRVRRGRPNGVRRNPAACPWSAEDRHTALTHPEVLFRDVKIEEVKDGRDSVTCLIITSPKHSPNHPGVRLPPLWDESRLLTYPPSYKLPKQVKRRLTPTGLEFSIPGLRWSVIVPYAWFDF